MQKLRELLRVTVSGLLCGSAAGTAAASMSAARYKGNAGRRSAR